MLSFDILAHNTLPNIKINMFKYSIICNVTANAFLFSLYLDRNVQIYHDKRNRRNCCKYMQFFFYILCIWIVPETWYLSSHLVSLFFLSSLVVYNEEQYFLCKHDILQVVLPGFFVSSFQSTGCQSSPLQDWSRTLQGSCHTTIHKPYRYIRY